MTTIQQPDWEYEETRVKGLTVTQIYDECIENFKAGEIAFGMSKSGFNPAFSQGYHHDIISILKTELTKRVAVKEGEV